MDGTLKLKRNLPLEIFTAKKGTNMNFGKKESDVRIGGDLWIWVEDKGFWVFWESFDFLGKIWTV